MDNGAEVQNGGKMKYKITRASEDEIKPCAEAFAIKVKYHPHDTEWDEWAVEINTLEELQDFVKKYDRIVLDCESITIYDSYLE